MGIKKNNPGCDCCGCVRGCEDTVTDPWVIQGSAANRYGSLTLTGVTASMVTNIDTVTLQLSILGSGERVLRVLGANGSVLCEYRTFVLEVAPALLTLTEVDNSGVSGTITKTDNDWPSEFFTARGTRRPKLTVNGTRVRRISWELIDVPDPWVWEYDTVEPFFPNSPTTLSDSWSGMSGLVGEYIVELNALQCRDGGNYGIIPYNANDPQNRITGTISGHSRLFNEQSQRLEWVEATATAYYGITFTDADFFSNPAAPLAGINQAKQFIVNGSESILNGGNATLLFLARTCLSMPQRTDAITSSNLTQQPSNYRSTGSVTWRVRLLET